MPLSDKLGSGSRGKTDSRKDNLRFSLKEVSLSGPDLSDSDTRQALAVCFFLLLAIALVFGQTVRHGFIDFDDGQYVYQNPHVAGGLTAKGILWAFTAVHSSNWHPLTWLSHMLDCQLYGLNAGGHHLNSILLHAAASVLLFGALRRMTGFLWRSAFVAAVFAIHPLRVESVAWIAERKDVLSGLFFMLTLWAYYRYTRRPFSYARYLAVAILFALGLMAKPMLITLPFVLLLLDYWPLGRLELSAGNGSSTFTRRVIVEKIPLLALAAASSAVTFFAQGKAVVPVETIPVSLRIANGLVSCVAYLEKLFYPAGLALFYPHPGSALPAWQVTASALILTAVSAAALIGRKRFPYIFVGWFWYLAMLMPVLGLVQVGLHSMADRYTYLPQIGISICVTWGAAQLTGSWLHRRQLGGAAATLVVLALMGMAWRQASYWRNKETLWSHTLDCTQNNYIAHYNLGVALAGLGQVDAAMDNYRKALSIKPDFPVAHNNLGTILAARGQADEAIIHYRKALEKAPDNAETHNNLGIALAAREQVDEALAHFRKSLEINPDDPEVHYNLGIVLASRGQTGEAITQFQKAVELKPDHAEAYDNLGIAFAQSGRIDQAIAHYQKALEIDPGLVAAHNNIGVALASLGQVDAAITHYRRALEINPDDPEVHCNLGIVLAGRGEIREAIAHYQKALEINPGFTEARRNLDMALKSSGLRQP